MISVIIKYSGQDVEVLEGDVVEYKPLLLFWKRRRGRVSYVPGISKFHPEMESNGLTWLGVSGDDGTFRGIFIDPETQRVKSDVRFVSRGRDRNYFVPDEIKEDEW